MKSKLRFCFLFLITSILFANSVSLFSKSYAQTSTPRESAPYEYERGIVSLKQALKDLTNPFVVMAVGASAADIDYQTIAYYRKKLGARCVITLATRDEAGEKGAPRAWQEETAVINTRRALAAANTVDSDVYFLNLPDSGFTKSADEALSKWGLDAALARLVRAIRLIRPDIIISRPETKSDDGQQQAVARLVNEAFDAASDVSRFAEPDTEPWRVSRVFQKAEEDARDATVPIGEYDADRGLTYEQIGQAALNVYTVSRRWPERFNAKEGQMFYKLKRSAPDDKFRPGSSLLDGIILPENLSRAIAPIRIGDASLTEAIGEKEKLIEAMRERLLEKRAEGTIAEIRARYGSQFFRMIRYIESLEHAIAIALGLSLEATLTDRTLVRGQKFSLKLAFRNGGSSQLPVVFHTPDALPLSDKNPNYKASEVTVTFAGTVTTQEAQYQIPDDAALTLPHSTHIYKDTYYAISSMMPGARDLELFRARLVAYAEIEIEQTTIPLPVLISFDIAPPIEMTTIPFALIKDWSKTRDFDFMVRLRNRTTGPFKGEFWIVPLGLISDNYTPQIVSFIKEDEETSIKVRLKLPLLKPPLSPEILMEVRRAKPAPSDAVASAQVLVKSGEFEMAEAVNVGYISGFDSWLGFALDQLGVEHTELRVEDLKASLHGSVDSNALQSQTSCAALARFDTIIIDNLAYFTRPDLITANACLLDFVNRGGTLVVLYQQPDDWNLLLARGQFAPFPIKLSKDRITIETAPVKILEPEHTLLTKPNKITEKDFEGWARDKAIYLPGEWATEYTALLESGDPGEEPRKGGLLVARHGAGMFVYTTFDWRTQALAMNTGAYRMLANIISLSKTSKPETDTKPPN